MLIEKQIVFFQMHELTSNESMKIENANAIFLQRDESDSNKLFRFFASRRYALFRTLYLLSNDKLTNSLRKSNCINVAIKSSINVDHHEQ